METGKETGPSEATDLSSLAHATGRRRTVHRHEVEGEDVDVALVAIAHARVEEAAVVRVSARLVEARVVERATHALAPRNLGVLGEVPEAATRNQQGGSAALVGCFWQARRCTHLYMKKPQRTVARPITAYSGVTAWLYQTAGGRSAMGLSESMLHWLRECDQVGSWAGSSGSRVTHSSR